MQLSHYFLRNAGLVGGVSRRLIVSNFSQVFAFDSDRKTSCLLQKCKSHLSTKSAQQAVGGLMLS